LTLTEQRVTMYFSQHLMIFSLYFFFVSENTLLVCLKRKIDSLNRRTWTKGVWTVFRPSASSLNKILKILFYCCWYEDEHISCFQIFEYIKTELKWKRCHWEEIQYNYRMSHLSFFRFISLSLNRTKCVQLLILGNR
jgi:hypothetical protein